MLLQHKVLQAKNHTKSGTTARPLTQIEQILQFEAVVAVAQDRKDTEMDNLERLAMRSRRG